MSRGHFQLRYHVCFLFIMSCLYLFSGMILDSAQALNASDFNGEECDIGGITATIMEGGKPAAGEKVYFFLAAGENDNSGALFLPHFCDPGYLRSCTGMQLNELGLNLVDFGRFKTLVTDANGNASFNFIRDNHVNYGGLEKALKERGSVKYCVVAYVFEEPLEKTLEEGTQPKVKLYAIAPVEFKSMDAIIDVRARDMHNVR